MRHYVVGTFHNFEDAERGVVRWLHSNGLGLQTRLKDIVRDRFARKNPKPVLVFREGLWKTPVPVGFLTIIKDSYRLGYSYQAIYRPLAEKGSPVRPSLWSSIKSLFSPRKKSNEYLV